MTTFVPYQAPPFQFQATLDDDVYIVVVTYNVTAQRPYINVYTQSNVLVTAPALVASPDGLNVVNLVGGYFNTSTLIFRQSSQQFEIAP